MRVFFHAHALCRFLSITFPSKDWLNDRESCWNRDLRDSVQDFTSPFVNGFLIFNLYSKDTTNCYCNGFRAQNI